MGDIIDLGKYKEDIIAGDVELRKLEAFHKVLEKLCPEVDELCEKVETTLLANDFVEKDFFDAIAPAVRMLTKRVGTLRCFAKRINETHTNPMRPNKED